MILTDRDIKDRASKLIVTGYQEKNVNPASYDLTIGAIVDGGNESDAYRLAPQEMIFIKTAEEIHRANNLLGTICEKQSRMREGLWVSSPYYFPGHKTYMFLRVVNLSDTIISLKKGNKIAQIFFETLTGVPDQTYDQRPDASYNNEVNYRSFGKYQSEYFQEIQNDNSLTCANPLRRQP